MTYLTVDDMTMDMVFTACALRALWDSYPPDIEVCDMPEYYTLSAEAESQTGFCIDCGLWYR